MYCGLGLGIGAAAGEGKAAHSRLGYRSSAIRGTTSDKVGTLDACDLQ